LEEYDKSLLLLKRYFQWNNSFYFKLNHSRKKEVSGNANTELVTEQGLELAKHLNSLDLELYDYAKEIFDERVAKEKYSFDKELKQFKLINPVLGASYAFMQSAFRKLID